jgi:hypothetical protein
MSRKTIIFVVLIIFLASSAFSADQKYEYSIYRRPPGLEGYIHDLAGGSATAIFNSALAIPLTFLTGLAGCPGLGAAVSAIYSANSEGKFAQVQVWKNLVDNERMDPKEAYQKTEHIVFERGFLAFLWGISCAVPAIILRIVFKKNFGIGKSFLVAVGCTFLLLIITIISHASRPHGTMMPMPIGTGITFCIAWACLWKKQTPKELDPIVRKKKGA